MNIKFFKEEILQETYSLGRRGEHEQCDEDQCTFWDS